MPNLIRVGKMFTMGRMLRVITIAALASAALEPARADAGITKTLDRKFPQGTYCPLESRAAAGVDLSFVAPASTLRITFSANNFKGANHNALHIDNVSIVKKSIFDVHLLSPAPGNGFNLCYDPTPPQGQPTGGIRNAPTYDYDFDGTAMAELVRDRFDSGVEGWTGQHLTFDGASTAPINPEAGTTFTGGSLALGAFADGAVTVSASKIVTGFVPGQQYVVFAWWKIQETDTLTINIGVPCADTDGDGFVSCTGCTPTVGETCGDCNPGNVHCTSNCTDADSDGWCITTDCDDHAAACMNNCAADLDADATPDCRDTCLDTDGDGYGTAGGAGNACLGPDCSSSNPWCNVTCTDADADQHCLPGDCDDANPALANGLAESNDCRDQQCPGSVGYGVIDETSGNSGFLTPGDKTHYSWPAQAGATSYTAVRASNPTFSSGCQMTNGSSTTWLTAASPSPGTAFYFLNRPSAPCVGSWGQRSDGSERRAVCGSESACANGLDDDSDGSIDCGDPDCNSTGACSQRTVTFTDTIADDYGSTSLQQFFQNTSMTSNDYIYFEIFETATRTVAWCSQNALFYKTNYLSFAPTSGNVNSGFWNKWRKAPATGNLWSGVSTQGHLNTFGTSCRGPYSWCSEMFPVEPSNSIAPSQTNDCEVYDSATSSCHSTSGGPLWRVTIRIGANRMEACGF